MVGFGKNYGAHISNQFKEAYLDYDKLKEQIHAEEILVREAAESANNKVVNRKSRGSGNGEWYRRIRFRSAGHEDDDEPSSIAEAIRQEIMRIEEMYETRLNMFETEFTDCRRSAHRYLEKKKTQTRAAAKASEAALKRTLTTFHKDLLALENYRVLNHTLCIKIVKKHDKELCPPHDPLYDGVWAEELATLKIGTPDAGKSLLDRVEHLYADFICKGELLEAQGKLRMAKGEYRATDVVVTAFKAGVLLTLMAWMANITLMVPDMAIDFYSLRDSSVYIYAFTGAFVIYRWVWGIMAYFWEMGRIKYVSLFDLDDSKHVPNFVDILSNACSWSILYMVNIIVYYSLKMTYNNDQRVLIPAWLMPTSLTMAAIVFLLHASLQKGSHGLVSRNMIWDVSIIFTTYSLFLFEYIVTCSPMSAQFMHPWCVPVTIRHIIATDVMTSLCKVFISMCYGACYYYTGTFLQSPDVEDMQDSFSVCLVSPVVHHASVVVCVIPFSIRWFQCARQQYDSLVKNKKIKPIVWRDNFCGWMKRSAPSSPRDDSTDEEMPENVDEIQPFTDSEGDELVAVAEESSGKISNGSAQIELSPRSRATQRRVTVITESEAVVDKKASIAPRTRRPKLLRSESREVLDPHWCAPVLDLLPKSVTNVTDLLIVWPYTFNMLKYSLSIVVVVMGGYPPPESSPNYTSYLAMFYFVSVVSTLYSCYWDFKNDWGLFQEHSEWPLLRPQLKYENVVWYYYLCLFFNPIFRCFWTLSFSPGPTSPFLSLFELLRRCMWGILRLEWAQINDDKQNASLLVDTREEKMAVQSLKRENSYQLSKHGLSKDAKV